MQAWGKSLDAGGNSIVTFMADPHGQFVKKMGLRIKESQIKELFGSVRCKRFSLMADDGEVKIINVAYSPEDPTGDGAPDCTFADKMISDLEKLRQ